VRDQIATRRSGGCDVRSRASRWMHGRSSQEIFHHYWKLRHRFSHMRLSLCS